MAQGNTCLVELQPQVDLSRIVALISMRTYNMIFAILACLGLAAFGSLPCGDEKDVLRTTAAERVDVVSKTKQTSAWEHHSMLIAFMFRVGSGAGPIRPSTDLRSAAATPEGKRMSTSSGFLRGYTPLGNPPSQYWTEHDALQPDDFSSRDFPDYRAHHGLSVSIPLRRTRPTGDRLR